MQPCEYVKIIEDFYLTYTLLKLKDVLSSKGTLSVDDWKVTLDN